MSLESPKHECGIIGVFSPDKPASTDLYYGLIALQNRGQEGAGIAVFNHEGRLNLHKDRGLVNAVFNQESIIDGLEGNIGIGQVRYGTTGGSTRANTQPFLVRSKLGEFAFATNGNIFNAAELRRDLEAAGETFESSSDSEVLAKLIATSEGRTFVEKIKNSSKRLQGAYSCVLSTKDTLIAWKDPHGVWPLSIGRINGRGYVVASETNAIEKIAGIVVRELENGEILSIDREGVQEDSLEKKRKAMCLFDPIYFASPESDLSGRSVAAIRRDMGIYLAEEHPLEADIVVQVPATGQYAAEGYARASKIPVESALIRNRWLGRTFIEPNQRIRQAKAAVKYKAVREFTEGKRVILVDDSIVRGTTTPEIIGLMRQAGATEVNMLVTAPPIIDTCHLGVDTSEKAELIAANKSIEEIRRTIGADYLGYLSLESVIKATRGREKDFCTGCFTGNHPMDVPRSRNKLILEAATRK